jgi:hypothetical protein
MPAARNAIVVYYSPFYGDLATAVTVGIFVFLSSLKR